MGSFWYIHSELCPRRIWNQYKESCINFIRIGIDKITNKLTICWYQTEDFCVPAYRQQDSGRTGSRLDSRSDRSRWCWSTSGRRRGSGRTRCRPHTGYSRRAAGSRLDNRTGTSPWSSAVPNTRVQTYNPSSDFVTVENLDNLLKMFRGKAILKLFRVIW